MKITKLELEMAAEEKVQWDILAAKGNCAGIQCWSDTGNCILHEGRMCELRTLAKYATVKVIQPPLVLTEGMDCSGLQLRSGDKVIAVFKHVTDIFMALGRASNGGLITAWVGSSGTHITNKVSEYDVIRKESV